MAASPRGRRHGFLRLGSLVLLTLASAQQARATTLYGGDISTGASGTGQNVAITFAGTKETGYAGQMVSNLDGGPTFYSYCVDLTHSFYVPSNWDVTTNITGQFTGYIRPDGSKAVYQSLSSTAAAEIGYLANQYADGKLDANHSAALQLAIWKLEYGSALSIQDYGSANGSTLFQAYVNAATSAYNSGQMLAPGLYFDPKSDTRPYGQMAQAFVTAFPEPSSYVLAGIIAVGLIAGYYSKHLRTASQAILC